MHMIESGGGMNMGKLTNHPEKERDARWALTQLEKAPFVTVCMAEGNEPYCVPVSGVVMDGNLYFHSSTAGRKCAMLERNPRVFISAVGFSEPLPEEHTMRYQSVQAAGRAELVEEGSEEKVRALLALCEKFAPSNTGNERCAHKPNGHVRLYRIVLEEITGKESKMGG
jgi:nitroimidazol reductase NimA-like FMN-containing flavoprotein (pyridoxamine 5'-phosphate oxidase superfamily)